jgi:hypothetical protein
MIDFDSLGIGAALIFDLVEEINTVLEVSLNTAKADSFSRLRDRFLFWNHGSLLKKTKTTQKHTQAIKIADTAFFAASETEPCLEHQSVREKNYQRNCIPQEIHPQVRCPWILHNHHINDQIDQKNEDGCEIIDSFGAITTSQECTTSNDNNTFDEINCTPPEKLPFVRPSDKLEMLSRTDTGWTKFLRITFESNHKTIKTNIRYNGKTTRYNKVKNTRAPRWTSLHSPS